MWIGWVNKLYMCYTFAEFQRFSDFYIFDSVYDYNKRDYNNVFTGLGLTGNRSGIYIYNISYLYIYRKIII